MPHHITHRPTNTAPGVARPRHHLRPRRLLAAVAAIAAAAAMGAALAPIAGPGTPPASAAETGTVTGHVTDATTGQALSGVTVALHSYCGFSDDDAADTDQTDTNGAFSLGYDPGSPNVVSVNVDGYALACSDYFGWDPSVTDVVKDIVLKPVIDPAPSITGTLTDAATSEPVTIASVYLYAEDGSALACSGDTPSTSCSTYPDQRAGTGAFAFTDIRAARGVQYYLVVESASYVRHTTDPFTLDAGGVEQNIALTRAVPESLTVSGTVTDAETSEPVASASVQLIAADADPNGPAPSYGYADADETGTFTLTNLPVAPGWFKLLARSSQYDKYLTSTSPTFELKDQNVTQDVQMTPILQMKGRLSGHITFAPCASGWNIASSGQARLRLTLETADGQYTVNTTEADWFNPRYEFHADWQRPLVPQTDTFRIHVEDFSGTFPTTDIGPFTVTGDTVENIALEPKASACAAGGEEEPGWFPSDGGSDDGTGGGGGTTVSTDPAVKVKAAINRVTLLKGHAYKVLASGFDADGYPTAVTYRSSAPKVATVNQTGKVKALKPGKATITITSGAKRTAVKITVVKKRPTQSHVQKIKVTGLPKGKTLKAGRPYWVGVKVSPVTALAVTPTYSVKGTKSAKKTTINRYGLLYAVGKGKVTLKVKAGGKTTKLTLTIK
ncbi:MAG: carboxypeptidase regulatory-like domain-containing protein [Bifidobacteriaceae bacterium]|jgi:hypothetical protein|nr:carboxypeptidase regulatory-like domain-containing protein [Bifidobacteriaceae bacterium]